MNPLTISALSVHLAALLEQDDLLRDLWVTGEVSNWKRAASGHIYFSLKDAGATISAVMWRNSAVAHAWLPKEGDQVLAHGYVGLYPERGAYQLYVNQLRPAGRGQLFARFEALKQELAARGLFDQERKRPTPGAARRIAVVTSADAAALRDVLRVVSARWPLAEVIVFSTLVQGGEAPAQIVAAIEAANRRAAEIEPLDVLLLVRGGGSIEDLWAFNDERVAQAIAASRLPVVSGVGHETDFTIADFVADVRAPTPSAAAAVVTLDQAEVKGQLAAISRRLSQDAQQRLLEERNRLLRLRQRLSRAHPQRQLDLRRQRLDERQRRLTLALRNRLERRAEHTRSAFLRLDALNPRRVLQRGYSIVQRQDGRVVISPDMAAAGEELTVQSAGGRYLVEVTASADSARRSTE
jgi:exodeoxyribonuclease VII large subunit